MTEASSASEEEVLAAAGSTPAEKADAGSAPETSSSEPLDANDPAGSSAADGPEAEPASTDAKGPQTLLEAVELASKGDKDAAPSPAESEKEGEAAKDAEQPGKTEGKAEDGETEEEPPPFHEHPRWKALVSQRDELITERDTFKAEAEAHKEDHEAITRLNDFMTSQQISTENLNELLQIGGLLRNDPVKALEAIRPTYEKLLALTGEILPEDLKQAMEAGHITEDYARQLARTRGTAQVETARSQRISATQQEEATARDQAATQGAFQAEANSWEAAWKASDPDYSLKRDRMYEKVELAISRKQFSEDPTKIRAKLDELRGTVEKELRALRPKPKSVNSNPAGGGSTANTTTAPKTLQEAMEAAVGG